jgi:hypothetical protein
MAKITVHVYGLIPGNFFDVNIQVEEPVSLSKLEKQLIALFEDKISPEYITSTGLINHEKVVPFAEGRTLQYDTTDLSHLNEIWFIVPLTGG